LAGESLNALHQILVAITISCHELADQRNPLKGPLLIDSVENGVLVNLGEFEACKYTTRLKNSVCLLQGSRDIGKVADTEGDRVKVQRVILDLRRQDFGICLKKREGGLLRCRENERALATNCQHVRVDVGNDNGDIGVAIEFMGVL
jgi:hypothetical protein